MEAEKLRRFGIKCDSIVHGIAEEVKKLISEAERLKAEASKIIEEAKKQVEKMIIGA